jgi:hypothetical protein
MHHIEIADEITINDSVTVFQFPLLGFLLCIRLIWITRPIISFFLYSFNSLYWDFCYASGMAEKYDVLDLLIFQFPLLGFLLCIMHRVYDIRGRGNRYITFNSLYWDFCYASIVYLFKPDRSKINFQFPLLGFLLCIESLDMRLCGWLSHLSIPFIGIFVMHLKIVREGREE